MAPEQVQGRAVDRRADVFAAGVLLFELLTARRLYARAGAAQSLVAIVEDPVPDPQSVTPDLEDGLVALCRRALAQEPSLRPATAAEMREALLACAPEREGALLRDSLAALMLHAFPERARAKAELVRRAQAGEAVTVLPEAETDTSIEIPGWSLPGGS
jgi:serine/threonine-protein kinase